MKTTLRKQHYFMVEMIMALALLMLLSTCFIVSLNTLKKLDASVSADRAGLLVVDNTVERLSAMPRYDAITIERIFRNEFAASGLPNSNLLSPAVRPINGGAILTLLRPNGKTLIEVTVKCRP